MKNKTHIRIVCLKNQNSQRSQAHHSGLIVPQNFQEEVVLQPPLVPSLAFLSARLQFNKKSGGSKFFSQQSQTNKMVSNQQDALELAESKTLPIKQDSFPSIEKYVQGQKILTATKKSTIKHMMGSIDLSEGRKRQKKIVKALQQTIQGLSKTEALLDKKQVTPARKYNNTQNRSFLQQDFQNFLHNKNEEFKRQKQPQPSEDDKFHRLTVVNPQKETLHHQDQTTKLNLFNFQTEMPASSKSSEDKLVRVVHQPHLSIARARLQQKMFRMQLHLKSDAQPFEWSRVKSKRGYSYQTINN